MADGLGLAASIIQIVSTGVQASVYLYNFADTVSSAGKALKEISDDISLTTSVLQQLQAILESEKQHGTASKEALSAAEALVQECSKIFESIVALTKKHFPPDHRKRAKLNFLKWPIIQPKIEIMRSNLEKHKTKLILMTQVLTLAKMAVSQQRDIDNQIESERQKLEALVVVSQRAKTMSKSKVNTLGLTEVFTPTRTSVDIVFIHGIFGHPKDTWTCDETDVFWPAELLPPILEDDETRILTYGYEAGADSFSDGEQTHKVDEVVGSFGRDLASNRQIGKATERPLIFVAHSLGGLILKGVLAHSSRSPCTATPNLRSISVSTYGVVFLATPHNILASHINLLCETAIQRKMSKISHDVERLKAKHTVLQLLNREFLNIAHDYQQHCFQELLEPKILDNISARLSMLHSEATCIRTDHYRICKFRSESSPGFDLVCAAIQDFVERAPAFISSRWNNEGMNTWSRNRILVSSKPLTVNETPQPQSGRGYYERHEYQPNRQSCGVITSALTPTRTWIPEDHVCALPEASSALAYETDSDVYVNAYPNQDWTFQDSSHVPPLLVNEPEPQRGRTDFGTNIGCKRSSKTTIGFKCRKTTNSDDNFDVRRDTEGGNRVDNRAKAHEGTPSALTSQSSGRSKPQLVSSLPPPVVSRLPKPRNDDFVDMADANSTLPIPQPFQPQAGYSYDSQLAGSFDEHTIPPFHTLHDGAVYAHQAPASSFQREPLFNNRTHYQPPVSPYYPPSSFPGDHGAQGQSFLNGHGNSPPTESRPGAKSRAPPSSPEVSRPLHYLKTNLPQVGDYSNFELSQTLVQQSALRLQNAGRVSIPTNSSQVRIKRQQAHCLEAPQHSSAQTNSVQPLQNPTQPYYGSQTSTPRVSDMPMQPQSNRSENIPNQAPQHNLQRQPNGPDIRQEDYRRFSLIQMRKRRLPETTIARRRRFFRNSDGAYKASAPENQGYPSPSMRLEQLPTLDNLESPANTKDHHQGDVNPRMLPPRPPYDASRLALPSSRQMPRLNPPASPPTTSTASPNLQILNPTREEQANAKEEVLKLLSLWTTVDASKLVGREKDSTAAVETGVQGASIVCYVGTKPPPDRDADLESTKTI